MQKQDRQNQILRFIEVGRVTRQEELVQLLANIGFDVTQTSISRDLLELGISKRNGRYTLESDAKTNDIFAIQSVENVGDSLIVLKCGIGMASAAALKIDKAEFEGVVGTIAGDDTIFIAIKNSGSRTSVVSTIANLFKNG